MKVYTSAGLYPHPPVLIPEVGGEQAGKARATAAAMKEMAERVAKSGADSIIVITPHGPVFHDVAVMMDVETMSGSMERFGAPDVKMECQVEKTLVKEIMSEAKELKLPLVLLDEDRVKRFDFKIELDHGAFVPLYFLRQAGVNLPIVHITYGWLPPLKLSAIGKSITRALLNLGRNAALVISGDLSHCLREDAPGGFSPKGEEYDREIARIVKEFDFMALIEMDEQLLADAGECAHRSLVIGMGAMDGFKTKPEILSYEAPFGVGYMVADFHVSIG